MRSVPNALEQLLFPAECVLCHALLPLERSRDFVCPLCRHRWRPVVPPWCERCGQPEPLFGRCRVCRDWPAALRQVRSAVWLDGAARRAVHALKYGGLPRIAADLAAAVARLRPTLPLPLPLPLPGAGAALVPVPLGARRLRIRGYNQSALLAHALARRWRYPVRELLVRTRETATQTTLTPAARLANVAGAFEMRNRSAFPLRTSTFVLVDDVFTTGATLAAAALALEAAGAQAIVAVTFGRAIIPDFLS